MFGPIERKGFCRGCVQNIRKVRQVQSRWIRFLDKASLRVAAWFNIGPWKCRYCGTFSFWLMAPIRGIRDFEDDFHRDEEVADQIAQSNFLKREKSLVSPKENAERFSEKYRKAVAAKILRGEAAVSQTCRELNINERDLTTWLREYVDEQQQLMAEEIYQLKNFISQANQDTLAIRYQQEFADKENAENAAEAEKALNRTDQGEAFSRGNHSPQSPIIEGQVKPLPESS